MLGVRDRDTVRAAVHRTLYLHFNGRPEEIFDVKRIRVLIADDTVATTGDLALEADISALIRETIEDHIAFLWRNGASHTFHRVSAPGAPPAWSYASGGSIRHG
ncbi:hypothetical protein [Rhizobium sp. Root1204]|uniref:hypothetical protein n=1 Tax=Rhizobium sp. Root1204 TaxID=1736428 RepID=UPI0012E3BEB6|nr:hypothetical protein [Rhizobium sp. Root1204]